MQTFHASLLILISCYLQTSSSFIHSHQTIKNTRKSASLWSMTSTDISKITPILVEQSNDFSSLNEVVVKKRVPIGSEPEFYIPDDSTIETSSQRLWIAAHFSLFAFNLFLFVQGALASVAIGGSSMAALVGLKLTSYAAITIISIILGDFATGVFHWSVDNYGSLETPVVGSVCAAFQGHHTAPWTITFRSFCNNLFKVAKGTVPALTLLALTPCNPETRLFFTLFINWWLLSQEFHKWSHMRSPPAMVRKLQDWGVILSRRDHGRHHSEPFDSNYCILTGVCNPLLDRSGLFPVLEKVVLATTGNRPKNWAPLE